MYTLEGFGERLKTAIKNSGYSQKEVSEKLQINQDTITNYVKEKSLPNADAIFRLCKLLEITSDYLLFGKDSDSSCESLKDCNKDAPNEGIGNISDEEKGIILKFRSGLQPIFDSDIKQLTGEVGRLNDQEHDLILKYRELNERERYDIYDNVCWKYDRLLNKKLSSTSRSGGPNEEAATSETA